MNIKGRAVELELYRTIIFVSVASFSPRILQTLLRILPFPTVTNMKAIQFAAALIFVAPAVSLTDDTVKLNQYSNLDDWQAESIQ